MSTRNFLLASLLLVIVLLFACGAFSELASDPDKFDGYPVGKCQVVEIHGRRYLIQLQQIGYMRTCEWRVVAAITGENP